MASLHRRHGHSVSPEKERSSAVRMGHAVETNEDERKCHDQPFRIPLWMSHVAQRFKRSLHPRKQQYSNTRNIATWPSSLLLYSVLGWLLVWILASWRSRTTPSNLGFYHSIRPKTSDDLEHLPITLPHRPNPRPFYKLRFRHKHHHSHREPDYGDIDYFSLHDYEFQRRIDPHDAHQFEKYRKNWVFFDQKLDKKYDHDEELEPSQCRRNNWRSKKFPVCNNFHEQTLVRLQDSEHATYKGHGYFRDAWLLEPPGLTPYVLKRLRLVDSFDFNYWDIHRIHREAIIMERLTKSPRIVDIYGYCGNSLTAEHMPREVATDIVPGEGHAKQTDLDKLEGLHPMNNYTDMERLEMALIMAESLADLHGYEGGVIIHGDTHPVQWLRAADGTLKLNDFNNGIILDWDEQGHRYCREYRKFGGMYRAPEEFKGKYVDEGIDTFSMGNNIYTLITGLWPFYEDTSYSVIQKKLFDHQAPYVDPRYIEKSYISRRLIEVMQKCWEHDARKRISIFSVVKELRSILKDEKERNSKRHAGK